MALALRPCLIIIIITVALGLQAQRCWLHISGLLPLLGASRETGHSRTGAPLLQDDRMCWHPVPACCARDFLIRKKGLAAPASRTACGAQSALAAVAVCALAVCALGVANAAAGASASARKPQITFSNMVFGKRGDKPLPTLTSSVRSPAQAHCAFAQVPHSVQCLNQHPAPPLACCTLCQAA